MTREMIESQIKSLELQLAVLRAEMKQLNAPPRGKTFADLYGILAGKVSSSEEEIEAAKYRFEWEGAEER